MFGRVFFSSIDILRNNTSFDNSANSFVTNISSDGIFTVKTAYLYNERMIANTLPVPGPSSYHQSQKFWTFDWKLHIPRKLKIFVWRTFHNGVQVGSELVRRHITKESKCRFCNFNNESSIHIFKDCWFTKALWVTMDLKDSLLIHEFSSAADWLFYLSGSLSTEEFCTAITCFWFIWYNRNLLSHDTVGFEVYTLSVKIHMFLNRYQKQRSVYQTFGQSLFLHWVPPPKDFVKMNSDGSWISKADISGLGVICRDSKGLLLASQTVSIKNVPNCFDAEGLALECALMLAKKLQYDKVLLKQTILKLLKLYGMAGLQISFCNPNGCSTVLKSFQGIRIGIYI